MLAPEPLGGSEEADQDARDRKELRAAFSEIRQLENKLRLIEHRKPDAAERVNNQGQTTIDSQTLAP